MSGAPTEVVPEAAQVQGPAAAPGTKLGQPALRALVLISAVAFLLRFFPAQNDPTLITPDEIYQVLEPAHRLSFGYGVITWEFRQGLRSWALPGAMAGIMRLTSFVDTGADGYLAGITLVLSYLSLTPVLAAFLLAYRRHREVGPALVAAMVGAVWFELVYLGPKPLTEVVATHALVPGLYLLSTTEGQRRRLLLAGGLMGLALGLRIHLLPAVALGLIYQCRADVRGRWAHVLLGLLPVLLAFGLLDWITWGAPFQSMWKNFVVNVVDGRSGSYSVAPWYTYARDQARLWGLGLLPIAALIALGARRWPVGLIVAVGVLGAHSAIAHKEYRFVYPALSLLMMLAGLGTAEALQLLRGRAARVQPWVLCVAAAGMWATGSIALGGRLDTDHVTIFPAPAAGERFPSLWTAHNGGLNGLRDLARDPRTCGVGLGIPWYFSGGYTYLHRNIPILEVPKPQDLKLLQGHFNTLLAPALPRHQSIGPYQPDECYYGVCLYRRVGGCQPPPAGYHINQVLIARDQ